ncbi:MAG: hypothetical protein RIR00_2503 [Pseudomonadota bacterium]|jgi:hypothetical protein
MASAWGDSWAGNWGDSWGAITSDPNALRGTIAGSSTAGATLSAIAWIAGSSAGSSTAQAYLELDGGVSPEPSFGGGATIMPLFPLRRRRRDEDVALLLCALH